MSLKDTCIFWNKLESVTVPISSEIGNDLDSKDGVPSSVPGKFGNAIYINANGNRIYQSADQPGIKIIEGVIGFYAKFDFDVVGGKSQNGKNHDILYFYDNVPTNFDQLNFGFFSTLGNRWVIGVNGTNYIWTNFDTAFTAGVWYHIMLVWDVNHATKKRRIYVDGIEVTSDNNSWSTGTFDVPVLIGSRPQATGSTDFTIDNPKIYDDASDSNVADIIANRNNEGFPELSPSAFGTGFNNGINEGLN